nr:MAG TPA: hypothetical protein [Caudoviricetes sp.]
MERSYQIQALQIKEMMGTISKEESNLLNALIQAENELLDSWVEDFYY